MKGVPVVLGIIRIDVDSIVVRSRSEDLQSITMLRGSAR
jgi:hypothetical protein